MDDKPGKLVLLAIVSVGIALRIAHYVADPSVWHDEAALMISVLETPWNGLLGRLQWNEAAPPLFVAIEKAAVSTFGDSTFIFRAVALLASCISLVVLTTIARRLLDPYGAAIAVALFAFSDRLLWHSCEAKPYAVDVLVSTLAIGLVASSGAETLVRRLVILTLLAPMAVWISFPACFVVGGLLIATLPLVLSLNSIRGWAAYLGCGVTTILSFAALALGPVRAQRTGAMESCWTGYFADWSHPWFVPIWILHSTIGTVDYGLRPIGGVLIAAVCVGAWSSCRSGRTHIVVSCLAPAGLALAASLVGAYPFGGARVSAFLAPAYALLAAEGLSRVAAYAGAVYAGGLGGWMRWAPAGAVAASLAVAIAGVIQPWARADVKSAVAYVNRQSRPTDQISSNAWESVYYFRGDPRFHANVPSAFDTPKPIWLAFVCEGDDAHAEHFKKIIRPGWSVSKAKRFPQTTVALLEPLELGPRAEVRDNDRR